MGPKIIRKRLKHLQLLFQLRYYLHVDFFSCLKRLENLLFKTTLYMKLPSHSGRPYYADHLRHFFWILTHNSEEPSEAGPYRNENWKLKTEKSRWLGCSVSDFWVLPQPNLIMQEKWNRKSRIQRNHKFCRIHLITNNLLIQVFRPKKWQHHRQYPQQNLKCFKGSWCFISSVVFGKVKLKRKMG